MSNFFLNIRAKDIHVQGYSDKLVGECNTWEEVTIMKEEQSKKVLKNVKSSVKECHTSNKVSW